MPIQYIEIDLRNKTTSKFRTFFHSPLGVPNSQVPLYLDILVQEIEEVYQAQTENCHFMSDGQERVSGHLGNLAAILVSHL